VTTTYPALDRTAIIEFDADGPLVPFTAELRFDAADGTVTFLVTHGSLSGRTETIPFTAQPVSDDVWLVSWQEEGDLTVLQVQDFATGVLRTANVTSTHDLVHVNGSIRLAA